jgi:hypothetical protein
MTTDNSINRPASAIIRNRIERFFNISRQPEIGGSPANRAKEIFGGHFVKFLERAAARRQPESTLPHSFPMRQSVNDNGSLEWPVQDQTWAKSCQSVSSVAGSFCFGLDLRPEYKPIVHAAYDYKRSLIAWRAVRLTAVAHSRLNNSSLNKTAVGIVVQRRRMPADMSPLISWKSS